MTPQETIREKGLRATPVRTAIAAILIDSSCPLTEAEIKKRMSGEYDRVTFYRALKAMLETGVIHSISHDGQSAVYALNHGHSSEHAHFVCDSCHRTICLDDSPGIDINLPAGFSMRHTEVILHGICDSCSGK